MTKDEIIRMAQEAGIEDAHFVTPHPGVINQLERFAKLVAAPSQRKPLTWEQISQIGLECANDKSRLPFEVKLARAIEQAHGIKDGS